jgi:hypothetical protein
MTTIQFTPSTTKLASIKLDNVGNIKLECGIQNDPRSLGKLKISELAYSIAVISVID